MNTQVTHARSRSARIVAAAVSAALLAIGAPSGADASSTEPLAKDGFDRTTSSGWGTAPTGGAWSVIGGSGSSVAGSAATVRDIQPGRSLRANLASVKKSDVDFASAFVVPKASEFYFSVEGRRQADGAAYRGRARVAANGELKTDVVRVTSTGETVLTMASTGTKVVPGQSVSVEMQVTGTSPVTLRTRTWLTGRTVPAWNVTYEDRASTRIAAGGTVGLWAHNTSGNPAVSVSTTEFSSSTVDTTPVPTTGSSDLTTTPTGTTTEAPVTVDGPVAKDGFDRTTSAGWGSAPTGGAWSVIGGSGSSVAGSAATVRDIQPGRSLRANLAAVKGTDVDVASTFVVPKATEFYFSVEGRRQSDGAAYRGRARIAANGELKTDVVRVTSAGEKVLTMATTGMEVSPGQEVSIELQVTGTSPVTLKTRTWLTGGTVPAWDVTYDDTASDRITGAGTVGLWAYNSAGNTAISVSATEFSSAAVDTTPAPTTEPSTPTTSPTPTSTPTPGATPTSTPTPGATPTSTPTPSESEAPPLPMPTRGSLPVGQARYPVPSGAVFVSTTGSDAAAGTAAAPLATVTKALSKVQSGGTVVLRGGTYREYFIVPPGKDVAIQNYPGEAVWFDGSRPVTGFTASGSSWVVGGWTTQFDSSPTYTKGAPDGTTLGWQFVNPAKPMAAHPDAVWIDGVEQAQVGSTGELKPGTFYVDYAAQKLYLGSDPTGKKVEASTMAQAVSLRAPGTVLRGMGFRRFGDSVWMQGVITSYYANQTIENVVVADAATAGIGLFKEGSTVRNVTITGAGQIAMQASYADNLTVDNVLIENANDQGFNPAPSAGGFKVTTTRGVVFKNSEIRGTTGNNFWTDQSTYDIDVLNNYLHDGSRWGMVLEISSTATVAGNVIANNAFDGVMISDTDKVNIWNNTIVNNKKAAIALVQDSRRIEQLSVSGHDKRRPQPDLTMPWITRGTTIGNNVMTGGSTDGADPILRVSSWEKVFDGNQMLASSNGNVFSQTAVGAPKYVTIWSKAGSNAPSYTTLFNYTTATGQDKGSYNHIGASPVDSSYRPVAAVKAQLAAVAQPLPAEVASKLGEEATTQALGAWR